MSTVPSSWGTRPRRPLVISIFVPTQAIRAECRSVLAYTHAPLRGLAPTKDISRTRPYFKTMSEIRSEIMSEIQPTKARENPHYLASASKI